MKPFLILPVLLFLSMVCAAQQRDIRVVGDYEELADTISLCFRLPRQKAERNYAIG